MFWSRGREGWRGVVEGGEELVAFEGVGEGRRSMGLRAMEGGVGVGVE